MSRFPRLSGFSVGVIILGTGIAAAVGLLGGHDSNHRKALSASPIVEVLAARSELHQSAYWPAANRTQGPNHLWRTDVHLGAAIAALTTPTTTTAPSTTTAPTTTTAASRGCFAMLKTCNLPGPGVGDGVPASTVLKSSTPAGTTVDAAGQINVNTANLVIDGYDIRHKLQINANGVHISSSLLEPAGVAGQTGVEAINIAAGVTGVVIDGVECRSSTSVPIEACLATGTGAEWTATRVYFHDCPDCIETYGHGSLIDSYVITDKMQPGDHVEPIYLSTSAADVDVRHSVLLNPQRQTAVIFVDNFGGSFGHASVSDGLVGGGGWSFYTHVDLTRTAMVRCLTPGAFDAPSGGTPCSGGQDSHGYWYAGGFFGFSLCPLQAETWTNVTWDDNGSVVVCQAGLRSLPTRGLVDGRPRGALPVS